jgi:nicotinamide-nucleotide amidase
MADSDLKEFMLRAPPLTLAVAESLTSGRLQARIGAISGASKFFLGGATAYGIEQKARLLGVDEGEARKVNAVSEAVAVAMAKGACAMFGSDVGAATTGYAEPSPEFGVDAPYAWWALARRRPDGRFESLSGRVDCRGLSREQAQERAAGAAFDALLGWLRGRAAGRTP